MIEKKSEKVNSMDATEKAFDNAIDSSKLLITLATSVIAFSVAFFDKEALMKPQTSFEKVILLVSWIVLLASAIVGILWTQMAFISILKPPGQIGKMPEYKPDLRSRKITFPFNLQSYLFLGGVFSIIVYGCVKIF
jgi:hypothetical protein